MRITNPFVALWNALRRTKSLFYVYYFVFAGIGTIATWLNHTQISLRFTEKESLLIYGLSSLFSVATPIVFGLFSDKTAQPKKASTKRFPDFTDYTLVSIFKYSPEGGQDI